MAPLLCGSCGLWTAAKQQRACSAAPCSGPSRRCERQAAFLVSCDVVQCRGADDSVHGKHRAGRGLSSTTTDTNQCCMLSRFVDPVCTIQSKQHRVAPPVMYRPGLQHRHNVAAPAPPRGCEISDAPSHRHSRTLAAPASIGRMEACLSSWAHAAVFMLRARLCCGSPRAGLLQLGAKPN